MAVRLRVRVLSDNYTLQTIYRRVEEEARKSKRNRCVFTANQLRTILDYCDYDPDAPSRWKAATVRIMQAALKVLFVGDTMPPDEEVAYIPVVLAKLEEVLHMLFSCCSHMHHMESIKRFIRVSISVYLS